MRLTSLALLSLTAACYGGELVESPDTLGDRELSAVAGPPDLANLQPVEAVPRALFGTAISADALTFPSLGVDARALFDAADPESPLSFFITARDANRGLGPLYNQTRCLGCHQNGDDNALTADATELGAILLTSSPMTRAGRTAVTHQDIVATPNPSPTAAYTVFGDYFIAEQRFDGLELWGGPIRQLAAAPDCFIDQIPEDDDNLGVTRQLGERAAPSYVGRGLIEAIYGPDIEALSDPADQRATTSTLVPAPSCAGDCISGRANLQLGDPHILGTDPVVRVGRFGLRANMTTLLEPIARGAHDGSGLTHPFIAEEEQNPLNAGLPCDIAPDPELTSTDILALWDMVRALAPPEPSNALLESEPSDAASADVQAGARLFGVDLAAFRSRMIAGSTPVRLGDADADHAIAADRQLNCVGCHTPIMVTGASPAVIAGEQLSNRWVALFSDLLIHDMGSLPLDEPEALIEASHPFFRGVRRNLADFALPNPGLADGAEWRTAPLLAFGLVGPPYLHDGRVFLNPRAPAYFYFGSRSADLQGLPLEARRLEIINTKTAIQAAIELHDLPQPPDADGDGVPDYASCPDLPSSRDWCGRESPFRSEARNVIEKWHALEDAQQQQVIRFLEAL